MQNLKEKIIKNKDNIITGAFFLAPGVYWLIVVLKYGTV